jgi:hypothetical protein
MLRLHHITIRRSNVRAQPLPREHLFRLELLEPRLFLTIAASLSGAIKAETNHPYSAYIQTTGTQAASPKRFTLTTRMRRAISQSTTRQTRRSRTIITQSLTSTSVVASTPT